MIMVRRQTDDNSAKIWLPIGRVIVKTMRRRPEGIQDFHPLFFLFPSYLISVFSVVEFSSYFFDKP